MRKIITQLTANNQLLIRYTNRPNCLKGKQQGDLTAQTQSTYYAHIQQKIENLNKLILHGCKEYLHDNYFFVTPDAAIPGRVSCSVLPGGTGVCSPTPWRFPACSLGGSIEYFDTDSNKIVQKNYWELAEEKRSLLDIISKNQQVRKTERCWGKPQTLKRFTLNAKQKILEAGAVVDRDCGKEASFELTLTIPGGGYEVFQVVSQWSGWIVNRQTQIIRRLEAKGYKIYWFYVWEHQKRGALHQHWCISIPDSPTDAYFLAKQIRAKWFELLQELSAKTGVDLFKKKGSFWSWKNTPEVWQSSISQVRKSVAAYFSKYASKNAQTSRYNEKLRQTRQDKHPEGTKNSREHPIYTLCPSRYWGSGSLVKNRCKQLRVTVEFDISSSEEGEWIFSSIREAVRQIRLEIVEVSRYFRVVDPETDFIYCSGWERRIWFDSSVYDQVFRILKRVRNHPQRVSDPIGAMADLIDW